LSRIMSIEEVISFYLLRSVMFVSSVSTVSCVYLPVYLTVCSDRQQRADSSSLHTYSFFAHDSYLFVLLSVTRVRASPRIPPTVSIRTGRSNNDRSFRYCQLKDN